MAVDQRTLGILANEQETSVQSYVSAAAPAINVDYFGSLKITAQAVAITSIVVTGTPRDLQPLTIRILDNGGAQNLAFGSSFEDVGVDIPTITVAGKRHTLYFLYDLTVAKYGLVWAAVED